MSIESAIEKRIQEAMARGEFDYLEGKCKPIDLSGYFSMPEDLRMAYALLRSSKFIPEEIEMMREIAELRRNLKHAASEREKATLNSKLNEKILALNIAVEKYKRRR
jgi:hypothetical protein